MFHLIYNTNLIYKTPTSLTSFGFLSFIFSSCNVFMHPHCKYPFRSLYSTSSNEIKTSTNNLPVKLPSKDTVSEEANNSLKKNVRARAWFF
jgi:hypothetical protein